ncbi:Pex24p-domain-containing protein [Coniochaeta ligniaria NRRL 30616]|uniref:Pex24p-domain-containing protein n=1 Tax=Coniochaeta ligniaria NRRL 30616 TaxID=1408157 RepID=A0A1J7IV32_9PEZI|nr:Pex24p-domain-containing protein [Coniochaeta ligniaria NRRL 30616]
MEDLAAALLNGPEESASLDDAEDRVELTPEAGPATGTTSAFKRHVLKRGIFKAASMQDKLLEKLLSQVIPTDDRTGDILDSSAPDDGLSAYAARPGFTIATMSTNFRRFNGRIGVVFKFQARVVRLLSWRRPTHTLSLLAVYTFLCLDPYLLFVLPILLVLVCVLIPSFIARHPAPATSPSEDFLRDMDYRPRGPPLAPAVTVKPVKELSRDFFKNLGHLQNSMEDFSVAHDKIVTFAEPKTNFSDETLSSAIFVLLCGLAGLMSLTAHLLPWRYLALLAGWAAICSNHPLANRLLSSSPPPTLPPNPASPASVLAPKDLVSSLTSRAAAVWDAWVSTDIILDSAPETREVEIFELQRLSLSGTGEWEPWVFSPSPYDPLSAARISGQRPPGTRFFEDVRPPPGWEWSEKKWALDLWSREWVEERIITGVEVETEGERWVYDIYDEHEGLTGVLETPLGGGGRIAPKGGVSWEEGEEGMGRRGEWRRRRWVRMVKRKMVG